MYTLTNLSFEVNKNNGKTTLGKDINTRADYNIKYYKAIFERQELAEHH